MRPEVPTRIFPGVQHPLAIAIFVRRADTDPQVPAQIRYTEVTGRREDKYAQLAALGLDSDSWRRVRTEAEAPFLPAAESAWDDYPALGDLFCWTAPGVKPNRTWVYAPHPEILHTRWHTLICADPEEKPALFKETRDRTLSSKKDPLPNTAAHHVPLGKETRGCPSPKRVSYRAFDRQWLIPDSRVIDFARAELWAAEPQQGQLFFNEQHSQAISSGPAVVFSTLIPDMHHFQGSGGGRVLPLLHPSGADNTAPRLLACLADRLEVPVTSADLAAYIAGVSAHPAFTQRFADELTTPGIRIPLTADVQVWREALTLGRELVWACTYGEAFIDPKVGRPPGDITFAPADPRRPKNLTPLGEGLPDKLSYTEGPGGEGTLHVGQGSFGPVTARMWAYDVGGMNVIKKWFSYRKANPGGKKTSPLDELHLDSWPREWIVELNELLTVLRRITELEKAQAALLDRVLAGPVITAHELATAGVKFPQTTRDRKPSYSLATTRPDTGPGQETLM